MANAMYALQKDRFLATVTNPGTDATDAAYPETNLQDGQISTPWKATTGTHKLTVQFDFGSAVQPKLIAIFNHNVTGTTLQLVGNSSATITSPVVGPTSFTMGSLDEDFYYPNTFLDLTASPPTACRYWFIVSSGTSNGTTLLANAPWAIGEVCFFSARTLLTNNVLFPFSDDDMRDGEITNATQGGVVWTTGSVSRRRRFKSSLDGSDAINTGEVRQWWRYSDQAAKASFFAIDSAVADGRLAYHAVPYSRAASVPDRNTQTVDLIEVAQGKPNYLLGF